MGEDCAFDHAARPQPGRDSRTPREGYRAGVGGGAMSADNVGAARH